MKSKQEGRVTIHDVARKAQVSIATVSRVMHGTYYVNPEISARVKRTITELGYVPDSNARGLKFKYRYMIGYVVSDISNQHFTAVSRAIEDVISPSGYSLIVCSNDSNQERELDNLRALLSHRVDGLIINTSGKNDEYIAKISDEVPVVLLHRKIGAEGFLGDYVGSDNYDGGRRLADILLRAGHRDIGLIGSDAAISTFRDRQAGFRDRLAEAGLELSPERSVCEPYSRLGGYTAMRSLLGASPAITAVCVTNNAMAVGAYAFLAETGKRVPEEVSVVSYGEIENADLFAVKPSFISQQPALIGRAAADLILGRIRDPERGAREEIIGMNLETGSSVRNLPPVG